MSDSAYAVRSGKVVPANCSTAQTVIAAVSGATLSLRSFIITSELAQDVSIEDGSANNIMTLAVEANVSLCSPVFHPGSFKAAVGTALKIKGAGADKVACIMEAYEL